MHARAQTCLTALWIPRQQPAAQQTSVTIQRRAVQRCVPQLSRAVASMPPPAARLTEAADAAAAAGSATDLHGQLRLHSGNSPAARDVIADHAEPDGPAPARTSFSDLVANRTPADSPLARTCAATAALRRPQAGAGNMRTTTASLCTPES